MLEFVPGRRYLFHTDTGQYIGTFTGKTKSGMGFTDVVAIIDTGHAEAVNFHAAQFLDAEPWLQSAEILPKEVAIDPAEHKKIAKDIKARNAVVIERATPGKDW